MNGHPEENDLLQDPEFLEWEAGLVGHESSYRYRNARSRQYSEELGEEVTFFAHRPGPSTVPGSAFGGIGNVIRPMFELKDDSGILRRSENNNSIESMTMIFPKNGTGPGDAIL